MNPLQTPHCSASPSRRWWAMSGLSVAAASSVLLWSASADLGLLQPKPVSAGTKAKPGKAPAQPAGPSAYHLPPEAQPRTVKLNYFSAPWEKVIKDVAEATNSQLVADKVPTGRFSRRDQTEYTRHDAIRIINKEIEPLGFRLIEKGDFLLVMDLPSQRPRYQPVVVSRDGNRDRVVDPNLQSSPPPATLSEVSRSGGVSTAGHFEETSITPSRRRQAEDGSPDQMTGSGRSGVRTVSAVDEGAAPRAASKQNSSRNAGRRDEEPRGPAARSVRSAAHEELADESGSVRPRNSRAGNAPSPLEDNRPALRAQASFRPKHFSAVDLSKQIYRAVKPRAQLIASGPEGLPSFRVMSAGIGTDEEDDRSAKRPSTSFVITIDEANDELIIEGTKPETDAVVRLLRMLDKAEGGADAVHLTSGSPHVCEIAKQLPQEIEKLREGRLQEQRQARSRPTVQRQLWKANGQVVRMAQATDEDQSDGQDNAGSDQPEGAMSRQPGRRVIPHSDKAGIGNSLSNLKGEVTVQSVDDLGVLILRGAEKDVEEVMKVIRELERLSVTTAPQVDLHYLKNVDAESMAELLTTVYESLTKFPGPATQPRQNAAIFPVTKPNSLLIVAPEADLNAILDLIEELDKPTDPLTEFQVFNLKTAIAGQVSEMITEFYRERKNLGAKVLVIADARSNSLIVRAQPRDLEEISALIKRVDSDESAAVIDVRVFPLKNAVAAELAAVINAAIQSVLAPPTSSPTGGGGQQGGLQLNPGQVDEQFKNVKSAVLQMITVDKGSEKVLKSGILADIRITPDARANNLVVAASEQSMPVIAALIKQLDKPAGYVSEIKVFSLANADADQMVQQLNALFNNQQQQGAGNNRQQQGLALAGADDAGSSLIPLKFSVDKRTNSIIASGSGDALGVVAAIIARLDESDQRARKFEVIQLKNSPAAQVATSMAQFFQSQRDLSQNDPNLVSSVEQLERDVIVIPDTTTNSLIISMTPRYATEVRRLVTSLDEAQRQVVIQALMVEVELGNTDEFGIELGFQDSLLFKRGLIDNENFLTLTDTVTNTTPGGGTTTTQSQRIVQSSLIPGFNFNNPGVPLGNNTTVKPNAVGSQGLSNFSLGRVNGDLGYGGLVLSAGSESINVLLRALAATRKIQVLSRPQIRALDNNQAYIFSGQQVPVVTNATTNQQTGVVTPVITPQRAGVELTVIPRINEAGLVVMQVTANRGQYRQEGVTLATDATGRTTQTPIQDLSTVTTTISVSSGQTVVIGGLINTRDETSSRKVPLLAEIPLIGNAFRYDSRTTRRTELLVILTPRILNGAADEEALKDVELGRLHYIESEAEEMHGPLRALPGPEQMFDDPEQPWFGPGNPPNGVPLTPEPQPYPPGPALENGMVPPPAPAANLQSRASGSRTIRDNAVRPASDARLSYTENDNSPAQVQPAIHRSTTGARTQSTGQATMNGSRSSKGSWLRKSND